jgi:hypothetical protein
MEPAQGGVVNRLATVLWKNAGIKLKERECIKNSSCTGFYFSISTGKNSVPQLR